MKRSRIWRYAVALAGLAILLPTTGCTLDAATAETLMSTILPLVLQAVLSAATGGVA